jgi:hypothetical protein
MSERLSRLALTMAPAGLVRNGGQKSLTHMRHPSSVSWSFAPFSDALTARPVDFNYAAIVGDGLDSSIVSAAICWVMRTFPEAPAVVQKLEKEQWKNQRNHALTKLMARPNPYYDGRILWMATCLDFLFGEAFWLKIRNPIGEVVQLWWVPRGLITPRAPADGSEFISYYDYNVGRGQPDKILPRDIVHFRFGMDPRNIRRGFSQLAAVMREVYTDEQACAFTASILRNLGVIGVIISPKVSDAAGGAVGASADDVKEVRDYIDANMTGEQRGRTLALGSPTEAQLLQYNLQGLDVGPIRDIPEERVCAAIGIPAAVIGFGTGLQQTKVGATMVENVKLAWKGCIMPTQKIMGGEGGRSLMPDFETANSDDFRVGWDYTEVTALGEEESAKSERVTKLFGGGIIKRSEARREIHLPTDAKDDIYVLPAGVTPLDKEGRPIAISPAPKPPADTPPAPHAQPPAEEA